MERKIRVGAVSYLNTKPLIYGFEQGMMQDEVELIYDYPSHIASLLLNDEIDLGLVPVAIIPLLKESHIISDYCIGADGPVASVCLFSECPLENVEKVFLDYQSRTSVALARLLIKDYWKLKPELVDATIDYREHITGKTAGLVIGDRAFEQRKRSRYVYDLGEAWKMHTGLPFVFAAWISNKPLDKGFMERFNAVNATGLNDLDKVLAGIQFNGFDLRAYYTQYISYKLDRQKIQGMHVFLDTINAHSLQNG